MTMRASLGGNQVTEAGRRRDMGYAYVPDRRVWASVLFRTTTPDIIEGVIVKRSERLRSGASAYG